MYADTRWTTRVSGVLGQCARERFPASLLKAVAEVDDAAAESVLLDELKIGARVGRQCGLAPTEHDWPDEQGQLVDEPGDESLCFEVRATDQQVSKNVRHEKQTQGTPPAGTSDARGWRVRS